MADVLVWLDMEMTGLDPERERIIEVATIITDGQLVEIATRAATRGCVDEQSLHP